MNIFWETIANYNLSTWPFQLLIGLIGVILTMWLIFRPNKWIVKGMKLFLALTYTWIGVVYYLIYCKERGYSDILCYFWLLMAGAWIWDLIANYTTFEKTGKFKFLAILLMAMPFIYPLLSIGRGLTFPAIASPIMPCAVSTFTIGLFLYHSKKINMFLVLFLCHWSFIGLAKTYFFDIPEDYVLVATSVPAIYIFFKQYYLTEPAALSKPNIKIVRLALIFVCTLISLILAGTILNQFYSIL